MADPKPDPGATFTRALTHADRLFVVLDDVAALGGVRGVTAGMKPKSAARLVDALRGVRKAVDEALADAPKAPKAKRKPAPKTTDPTASPNPETAP